MDSDLIHGRCWGWTDLELDFGWLAASASGVLYGFRTGRRIDGRDFVASKSGERAVTLAHIRDRVAKKPRHFLLA